MTDKKKRTMLCPYRVWTEVVPPVLRGQGEFTKQGFYECLKEDCICYRLKITPLCIIEKCVRGGSDDVFITELEVEE